MANYIVRVTTVDCAWPICISLESCEVDHAVKQAKSIAEKLGVLNNGGRYPACIELMELENLVFKTGRQSST